MSEYKWRRPRHVAGVHDLYADGLFVARINNLAPGLCRVWQVEFGKDEYPCFNTLREAKAALIAAYEESVKCHS